MYQLESYDYQLPPELIAQQPSRRRDDSRLLVLERAGNRLHHRRFHDIVGLLKAGDVLVVNDTRVIPARLEGVKPTGGRVELLVLDPWKSAEDACETGYPCLVKSSKPLRAGSRVRLQGGLEAEVIAPLTDGKVSVRFLDPRPLKDLLEQIGSPPLPPYIQRNGQPAGVDDKASYQTIYAAHPGAVAAPTAGLHFTSPLLEALESAGIERLAVTLHVGYGTFSPVRSQDIRSHRMHSEYAEISRETAECLQTARARGRRIVAVGTTVVRLLEWLMSHFGSIVPFSGPCDHYIYPGYQFRVVDAMITNFHLPRSSLLLLVSAFTGRDTILDAYRVAIESGYRFYSYGDAMLIL